MRALFIIISLYITSCSYLPEEIEEISGVTVRESADYISLSPSNSAVKTTGLMFYSGGLVAPQAYIPIWQEIAVLGYQVVIIKTSANLAIMNIGKAKDCIGHFPDVGQWLIGGHSLGGVVAAMDIDADLESFKGLILFASYPSEQTDLSDWNGAVLSLYAEKDALATPTDIIDNQNLLPPKIVVDNLGQMPSSGTTNQSVFHEIKGGNHSQFGSYGMQKGDGESSISKRDQHQEIVDYILSFLNTNQW